MGRMEAESIFREGSFSRKHLATTFVRWTC